MITNVNLPTTILFHDKDSIEAFVNTLAMIIPKVKYEVLGNMEAETPEGVETQYEAVLYTRKDKKYREIVGETFTPAEKNPAGENEDTSNTTTQ